MGAQAVRLSNVDIDKALENRDFEVRFQPIFDLGNGALARMETFVRWRHPSLGVLPPGAFISFFETQGRMSELTRYVLAEALDGYLGWRGPFEPGFSINLALTDVSDDAFARHFKKILRDRDFPADLVTLECPMPLVDVDMEAAAENFASLRECGARLAIEVRGRANDFLRTIDPFPFDEIKTGGASILRFARTVRGPGLSAISDLLDIANKANALITAVGVEDQASLAALRGLGFTAAQGNHLGKVGNLSDFRPGRVNEVRELLGLAALSAEDLTALFRTEAPALKTGDAEAAPSEDDDATGTLIERLQAHTEKQAARAAAAADAADDSAEIDSADQEKMTPAQQVMREKAKAVALAKRAKAREIRKAAAIKRAKAKAAKAQAEAAAQLTGAPDMDATVDALPPSAAPRALQDRLAKEYTDDSNLDEDRQSDAPASASTAPVQETTDANDVASDMSGLSVDEHIDDQPDELQFDASEAPEETPAPDEQATPATLEDDADGAVSLHVDAPGAHFRPVTRVSGDAHINQPQSRAAAPPAGPSDAFNVVPPDLLQQETQQFSFEEELTFEEEPAPPEASAPSPEPEASPELEPAPEPSEPPSEDTIVQGHLEEEHALDAAPAPKPRRKNLLTRRYKVVPTHFWPKPWKRRFVRWQKHRAATAAPHAEAAE
jgi:EAL domain-containing protein (putative c-di-GMP-specific phosphodiesterase class I)